MVGNRGSSAARNATGATAPWGADICRDAATACESATSHGGCPPRRRGRILAAAEGSRRHPPNAHLAGRHAHAPHQVPLGSRDLPEGGLEPQEGTIMRWRRWRDYPPRPTRPKVERLSGEGRGKADTSAECRLRPLARLDGTERATSATARGRFYVERDRRQTVLWGPHHAGSPRTGRYCWNASGEPTNGTKSPAAACRRSSRPSPAIPAAPSTAWDPGRRTPRRRSNRNPVRRRTPWRRFVDASSGEPCSAPEALFAYFGIPLHVLIQPRRWYIYHRTPVIVEYASDRSRVLVCFCSGTLLG